MMPLVTPLMLRPGGTLPPIVQDPAGPWAPATLKAVFVTGVPTLACIGLGVLVTSVVAPASECTAPSEAPMPAIERNKATMREGVANSATSAATRTAGVRCRRSTSQVAEKLIHVRRFIGVNKEGKS
jgi:hypothetical protein